MISRHLANQLLSVAKKYPVITITGPRQSGKTTCCRASFPDMPYFNLEDPDIREFASSDPRGFLLQMNAGGIIDEIQRAPELTSYLQGVVDDPAFSGTFVLTGSQNFSIRNAVSQSLAGRTALFTLLPFSVAEIRSITHGYSDSDFIYNGFYPRLYDKKIDPQRFYADYVGTYVERDLRSLSLVRDLSTFQIFLRLCAGRTGQILNLQSLANDCGISQATAREWISLLEASYILYRLPPFYRNIGKRFIKTPKIYFCDVGLAAFLLGISESGQVDNHPLKGQLFETLVLAELLKMRFNNGLINNLLYYRDSNGKEVDVIIPRGLGFTAIEVKSAKTVVRDFFSGLKSFDALVPEQVDKLLVYGGDMDIVQSGIQVTNLRSLQNHSARFMR